MADGVEHDPVAEVVRVLDAAEAASVPLRAIGGLAIALRAPSVRTMFPDRTYHDIDLVIPAGHPEAADLLESLGYIPERRFNALNGADRLLFHDASGRRLDVFVDRLRMCHELAFRDRVQIDRRTLPLADLLLSKVQIVELTLRDRQDLLALLADHPLAPSDADGISLARIEAVCGASWGWWRTTTGTLERLPETSDATAGDARVDRALARARELRDGLRDIPRSWRWRLRSVAGERLPWHEAPEEVR